MNIRSDMERLDWLEDLGDNISKAINVVTIGAKYHDIRGAIDNQIETDKRNREIYLKKGKLEQEELEKKIKEKEKIQKSKQPIMSHGQLMSILQ